MSNDQNKQKNILELSYDFSRKINQRYFKNNKTIVTEKRKKYIEDAANAAEKFDHNLPMAGWYDEDEFKKRQKYNAHMGHFNLISTNGLDFKPGIPFLGIRDRMKTFDLIGFHGGDGVSNIIGSVQSRMAGHREGGVISHTGMIVRASDFPQDHDLYHETEIYVWESTMSGPLAFDKVQNVDGSKCQCFKPCKMMKCPSVCIPNIPHDYGFLGIQFRSLGQLVINYDSSPTAKLVWCSLNEYNRDIADQFLYTNDEIPGQGLARLMDKYNGTSYNSTCCCLDLCAAVWPCCRWLQNTYSKCCNKVDKNGSQFCSEFNANIYKEIGILPDTVISNKVVPVDYLTSIKGGQIVSSDMDGDVPILYNSYILFTARSKLGMKLHLSEKFFKDLRPFPDFIDDRHIIPSVHIASNEMVSLQLRQSEDKIGLNFPVWDAITDQPSSLDSRTTPLHPLGVDPSDYLKAIESNQISPTETKDEDSRQGEVNHGADLPYPDINKQSSIPIVSKSSDF